MQYSGELAQRLTWAAPWGWVQKRDSSEYITMRELAQTTCLLCGDMTKRISPLPPISDKTAGPEFIRVGELALKEMYLFWTAE